ncbi:endonuclease domain-containing protein [Brevundimonas faecalis]|uniref:endonuclease domain-containing protein n=1 Tax=Brevundimonas faecalis TaxID=947378 RepID=UPI0036160BE7
MSSTGSVSRARVQRRALTPPEARLWVCLRRCGLNDLKFRRQHPIGPYVLDFYCAEAKLAVEVDGATHARSDRVEHDRRRTAWLEQQGLLVLRIVAEDVRVHLGDVLTSIRSTAESRMRVKNPSTASRSPSPSLRDREET